MQRGKGKPKGDKKMEELSLENVKAERENLDEYDREMYDFRVFKNCQESLRNLRQQKAEVYECGLSNFGEAMAEGKNAMEVEYNYLQEAYDKLHDGLYPIMKETYKGYKSHCEWCRIPYTEYEEFEEPEEDDLYHLLGLD